MGPAGTGVSDRFVVTGWASTMHDPIAAAAVRIRGWDVDEPRGLVDAAAALCRETLDEGGLPEGSPAWRELRHSFEGSSVGRASDVREIVCRWDERIRDPDLEEDLLDDQAAAIKLGIVTWIVKSLAKRLGLIEGAEPIPGFDEWRARLCLDLERYVGPFRDSWVTLSREDDDDAASPP